MKYLLFLFTFALSASSLPAPMPQPLPADRNTYFLEDANDPATPAHCVKMESDLLSCFDGTTFFMNDVEADQGAIKKCVCGQENFTMEIVTECTQDPQAWNEVCGDDLESESEIGF